MNFIRRLFAPPRPVAAQVQDFAEIAIARRAAKQRRNEAQQRQFVEKHAALAVRK